MCWKFSFFTLLLIYSFIFLRGFSIHSLQMWLCWRFSTFFFHFAFAVLSLFSCQLLCYPLLNDILSDTLFCPFISLVASFILSFMVPCFRHSEFLTHCLYLSNNLKSSINLNFPFLFAIHHLLFSLDSITSIHVYCTTYARAYKFCHFLLI